MGGLPEQIRLQVEMRAPPDLQAAMYLARAFERCVPEPAPAPSQSAVRPPRPLATVQQPGPATTPAAQPACPFRRLSPAEQLERRQKGLCFNCDEPYVRGHVCPRLFYLECDDYLVDEPAAEPAVVADHPEEPIAHDHAAANAFVVSLHAVAGIRPANSMLLPVTMKGERVLALLDTESTHNFLRGTLMRRLGLSSTGGEALRVTVANGDSLACGGIACDIPICIGKEHFAVTCVGLNLGGFDFILGFDFLRTLGPILWDCAALTMAFSRGGRAT